MTETNKLGVGDIGRIRPDAEFTYQLATDLLAGAEVTIVAQHDSSRGPQVLVRINDPAIAAEYWHDPAWVAQAISIDAADVIPLHA